VGPPREPSPSRAPAVSRGCRSILLLFTSHEASAYGAEDYTNSIDSLSIFISDR